MKKFIIIFCILVCCSSSLFAKHHHRGDHILTGYEFVSNERIGKLKHIASNCPEGYKPTDYVVYKDHELEFKYSKCNHTGFDYSYAEIIRLATKEEITKHNLIIAGIIIGIIIFIFGLAIIAASDSTPISVSYPITKYHIIHRYFDD